MKRPLSSLLAVVAVCGCTNEMEVANIAAPSNNKITFESPIVAPATRGNYVVGTGAKFPQTWKIQVWAKWHENAYANNWNNAVNKAYMTGVECASDDSTDAYEYADNSLEAKAWFPTPNAYYWPKVGKLTFQAVSMDGSGESAAKWAEIAGDGTGAKTTAEAATGYTFKNVDAQYDLMYSDIATDKTPGYASPSNKDWDVQWPTPAPDDTRSYEGVQLMFHHALSNILFKVGTKEDYSATTTIKVKSITLLGMHNKGNFTQGYTEATQQSAPAWTPVGTADYNYNNVVKTAGGQIVTSGVPQALEQKDLIVMPQDIRAAAEGDEGVRITIDYTITTTAGGIIDQTATQQLSTLTYKVGSTDDGKAFKPGKQYTFNIIFALDEIYFSPEVANWTDVTVTQTGAGDPDPSEDNIVIK